MKSLQLKVRVTPAFMQEVNEICDLTGETRSDFIRAAFTERKERLLEAGEDALRSANPVGQSPPPPWYKGRDSVLGEAA